MNKLQQYKLILITILVTSSFVSCEKVINLELQNAEPRIVVEAVLKDSPGDNKILLSYTSAVYTDQNFDKISNATVKVFDQNDNEFIFTEDPIIKGFYHNPTFAVQPESDYTLVIYVEDETLTSTGHAFAKPGIDSMIYYPSPFSFSTTDSVFMVEYFSVDNVNEANHYRLRIWINGVEQKEFLYIGNDDFINGQSYNAPFFGADARIGDTVNIELISMDKANYTYLYQLSANESNETAPANPTSNIVGNAIGYFGAFTTDTMSIIIY